MVNERDGLGDEVPPDYLTSVKDGGFYGWPWAYSGIVDDRAKPNPAMAAKALVPDYALGGHTASLGLCWVPAGTLPGFPEAWPSVSMAPGTAPSSPATSWYSSSSRTAARSAARATSSPASSGPEEKFSYGRPVGVTIGPDRKSLLMCDDVGDVVWRVTGA